jgi:hypothetical protein
LLSVGDLLPSELEDFFRATSKAPGATDKLDEAGFAALYESIDTIFEDFEETDGEEIDTSGMMIKPRTTTTSIMRMMRLLILRVHGKRNCYPFCRQ